MKFQKLKHLIILAISAIILMAPKSVLAIEDPLTTANNRFGIHIMNENDLDDAVALVNSSRGDWGYVTLVIREDEMDAARWQKAFDTMRRLHLIPIVRIASTQQRSGWGKLSYTKIGDWVNFFDSLNWVIKNRYIVVGNEPNHAVEWGGEVDPSDYGKYLSEISHELKEKSDDFFVLPAGFDASAPDGRSYMSEATFLEEMLETNPEVFDHIDGWTSHSYPNPDFSGSEDDTGRGSVRTYQWELEFIKSLGIDKDLPVFITETGWAHNGASAENKYKTPEEISESLINCFNDAWSDEGIVAVTPFILSYQDEPFSKFSWKKPANADEPAYADGEDNSFYEFYNTVKDIKKQKGEPAQINSWEILSSITTPEINGNNVSYGIALVKNTGQRIWRKNEIFTIEVSDEKNAINAIFPKVTEPNHTTLMLYSIESKI